MNKKNLTSDQKLDYLIDKINGVSDGIHILKQDVAEIKREVNEHTDLLKYVVAHAVTQREFNALEKRVVTLENV